MIFEPVAFSFDLDDVCVVQEAIKDCGGGGHVADEFAPFFEGSIGRHQGGAQFVASHNDLKKILS